MIIFDNENLVFLKQNNKERSASMKKSLSFIFIITGISFCLITGCISFVNTNSNKSAKVVRSTIPGKLTLPPNTPVAPRTLTIILMPPSKKEKVDEFYISFAKPSYQKLRKSQANNKILCNNVKPGETYYMNFGFINTPRWLVNNVKLYGSYIYGRIFIQINDQPPVEFTSGNIVIQSENTYNLEVYVP
jgi:hypothetical protein